MLYLNVVEDIQAINATKFYCTGTSSRRNIYWTEPYNAVFTSKDSSIRGVIWGHWEGYKGDSSSLGAHRGGPQFERAIGGGWSVIMTIVVLSIEGLSADAYFSTSSCDFHHCSLIFIFSYAAWKQRQTNIFLLKNGYFLLPLFFCFCLHFTNEKMKIGTGFSFGGCLIW